MPKSSKLHQLTNLGIRKIVNNAKSMGKARTKTDGGNLSITVSTTGHVAWVFRYQWFGKGKERTLDEVDTTQKDYGLTDAREVAASLRVRMKKGEDVAVIKREERMGGADTFKAVADEWYNKKKVSLAHPKIIRRVLDKDILPFIGALHPMKVKPLHVDRLLQVIVDRNAPTIANDALRYIQQIFTYARKRHIVEVNPIADFDLSDAGGNEKSRTRALSRSELATLFTAMDKTSNLGRENELTFKVLLATCVRKGELVRAEWAEFDLDKGVWHIPADHSKTKAPLEVPLAPVVVEWLQELKVFAVKSDYVLPARIASKSPHISHDTLNVALKRVDHGLEHFTIHDMRRTARTRLAELGVTSEVAERSLNHRLKGVEGIYNLHDYFDERKQALTMWADLLVLLEHGEAYNVIPFEGVASG